MNKHFINHIEEEVLKIARACFCGKTSRLVKSFNDKGKTKIVTVSPEHYAKHFLSVTKNLSIEDCASQDTRYKNSCFR